MSTDSQTPAPAVLPTPGASPRRRGGHPVVVVLAVAGSAAVAASPFLPWFSMFAGLHPMTAVQGALGVALVGTGAVALVLALVYAVLGAARLRLLLGLAGFAAAALALYMTSGLLQVVSELQADPMTVTTWGPGPAVAVLGALAVFVTLFLPDRRS